MAPSAARPSAIAAFAVVDIEVRPKSASSEYCPEPVKARAAALAAYGCASTVEGGRYSKVGEALYQGQGPDRTSSFKRDSGFKMPANFSAYFPSTATASRRVSPGRWR